MKKRLLLLIDDPNELKELRQALGSMEAIWDTSFGESASKSLEGLSAHPAAAIVATKRHQGSCGVQLLNHVARDHPATLRFMLADATDRELLLACAAQAHQCVVRPCPPAFLIRTLRRALTLDSVVANGRVKEFVSHSGALPALPSLYFSVLNHLDSPASTVQDVAREVAKDIAMTSKLLQLVNAAFLGLRQKVTSASDAISLLGLETLKSLVLSIHVFDHYEKFSSSGFSPERLWSHSLAVANASRQLTLMETRDKRLADEAFTAGLLHDVGKLIFMANATADYRRVIDAAVRDGKDLTLLETEAFGAAHPQAGA
ncbi:MAG: HDOD domain-containing protein, partial [Verrucomicrobia bacterium]|nr:HDOD domain-containing protein [Verrucomicrobiota bacterium]